MAGGTGSGHQRPAALPATARRTADPGGGPGGTRGHRLTRAPGVVAGLMRSSHGILPSVRSDSDEVTAVHCAVPSFGTTGPAPMKGSPMSGQARLLVVDD